MKRSALQFVAVLGLIASPAAAGSITTLFSGVNGFSGNMFDATIGASSLSVTSLSVNVTAGAETVDVYVKLGAYSLADESNPAAWTLVSDSAVTGLGQAKQTPVNVTPFTLLAGKTYGIYVTLTSTTPTMFYSNGNTPYSNADLSLAFGTGVGGLFGAGGGFFEDRTWNGTINYTLSASAVPEPASIGLFALVVPGLWLARRRLFA